MTTSQKKIDPSKLVPMDLCAAHFPLRVELAYAHDAPPNIFGKIYHDNAKLWLHEDLAKIVCLAAKICHAQHGLSLVLYDGLRTKEAQSKMADAPIAKANPQWMEEPRLLSPPGAGAHPRGMAIDMSLMDDQGNLIDMGTDFDYLASDQSADHNPAHRNYVGLKNDIRKNRDKLNKAVLKAAFDLGYDIDFLAQEWWDFRFPKKDYEQYQPLSDDDLPKEMRMVNAEAVDDFDDIYGPRVLNIVRELSGLTKIGSSVSSS